MPEKSSSFKTEFNNVEGDYQTGIQALGEKFSPKWLKNSRLSLLAIPLIGGDTLFMK